MKKESGETLIALIITIIVLFIILGVSIGAVSNVKETVSNADKDKLLANLYGIQYATLETYTKYKQTENENVLVGTSINWEDANSAINGISSDIELKGINYDELASKGINVGASKKYYKLEKEDIEKLGMDGIEDTYIVNYETGEVINYTEKMTVDNEPLYVGAREAETDYNKNGLVLWYDGIDNTGNGHSDRVKEWKNLVGSDLNGVLKGGTSWEEDSLNFNGTNGWVSIGEYNPENITIEAVVLNKSIKSAETEYITNFNYGGYGLFYHKGNSSSPNGMQVFIKEARQL